MYKVVRITDLNLSPTFESTDKVLELSKDLTKLTVAENDYAHKSKSYLSNSIDIADKSLKSYRDAINKIDTTYLTSSLNDIYLPNGSLVTKETFNKIMQSNAFLTKEACKEFETKCISYVNELKNKAVSIIMAQLNESFIAQNSVGKLSFGQFAGAAKQGSSQYDITWINQIATSTEPSTGNYNFETGEFSINHLLFDTTVFNSMATPGWYEIDENHRVVRSSESKKPPNGNAFYVSSNKSTFPDFWKDHYSDPISSYFANEEIEGIEELTDKIMTELAFNAYTDVSTALDYKVHVPKASYDFKKNESIPIAQLIEIFLKRQIKTAIKRICDTYISKMVSVPKFTKVMALEPTNGGNGGG